MPAIWVWIVNSPNRLTQAVEYVGLNFKSYAIIQTKYILAKNEKLYDQPARKQSANVFFIFLVKKDDKEAERMRSRFVVNIVLPTYRIMLRPESTRK